MNVLTSFLQLRGKKVKMSYNAEDGTSFVLITDDNSVMVGGLGFVEPDLFNNHNSQITVLNKKKAIEYILSNHYIKSQLSKAGVIDIEHYTRKAKEVKEKELMDKKIEEEELTILARLKAKYETAS